MITDYNDLFNVAFDIASRSHMGQTRPMGKDKGKPYIIHPIRVARSLDGLAKIVGILHDVLEDTKTTAENLFYDGMPVVIVEAVQLLSKREGDNYHSFIMRIIDNSKSIFGQLAIKVKIADLDDNMRDLEEGSMKDKYRLAKELLSIYIDDSYLK